MSASATVTAINGSSKLTPAEPTVSRSAIDKHVARLVTRGLRANTALNLAVRVLLGLFGLVSCALALRYIAVRGDEMVEILSKSTDSGDRVGKRLLVLCMPVLLFGLLAGLAAAAAWTMHARGQDETTRTLDMLSRLKREGEVAVSARGLMYAFEEKLQNARRALNLLLWLGRTLFLICIGLFAAAVINAMAKGADLVTVTFGVASVAGSLLAVAKDVPRKVKEHLADVIQVQTIVTGCDRQISLLESDALAALNNSQCGVADTHHIVIEVQERMSTVVALAVKQIEDYVDPAKVDDVGSVNGASA
ncbi:MAG TPA: hypothetical protein VK510_00580 [Solirubrobacteraceae bacterium]|nr:hypothetical protein [Solirubrobacteraceae bacterium]